MSWASAFIALAVTGALAGALSCDSVIYRPGVGCDRDEDCAAPRASCNVSLHLCVDSDDGGGLADGGGDLAPACSPATATADCMDPGAPICESASCRACSGAGDDAACAARSAATPRCKPSGSNAGRCVACLPSTPIAESTACGASAPVCGDEGACRPCQANAECASGICVKDGAAKGSCIAAAQVALVDNAGTTPAACKTARAVRDGNAAATAYCDVTEAVSATRPYVLVKGSAEPYSAIALTDQSITIVGPGRDVAPSARIFTVAATAVNVAVNSGAREVILDGVELGGDAFSKAVDGLLVNNSTGVASNATVVLRDAAARNCNQDGVAANAGVVSVIDATIAGTGMSGLYVNGGTVTVSGASLLGSQGTGVYATGGTLSLTGTRITGYNVGVNASGGTLTLVRSVVQGNAGGGLRITDGNYRVENNLIAGNGLSAPGVVLSGTVTGTFWFNTIVGNQTSTGVGGVNCAGVLNAAPLLQASIFWGNKQVGGASTTGCNITHSDLDDAPTPAGAGNFSLDPLFVDAVGYRLQSTSPCKDKLLATDLVGTAIPVVDIDGAARPAGASYDIGADEL